MHQSIRPRLLTSPPAFPVQQLSQPLPARQVRQQWCLLLLPRRQVQLLPLPRLRLLTSRRLCLPQLPPEVLRPTVHGTCLALLLLPLPWWALHLTANVACPPLPWGEGCRLRAGHPVP